MFDQLKGMASIAGLLKDLPKIRREMEQVKMRLAGIQVEAQSGGGAVTAIASGDLRLRAIHIDHAMMNSLMDANHPSNRELAQDLIVGAVNASLEKAREVAAREMANAAEELGLPIPPTGLGGLLS